MPNAKVLSEKQAIVADLAEQMKNASAGVLVDYRGITVADDTALRTQLREAGVRYSVVKNTLTRLAAKEAGYEELSDLLNGTTALAICDEDPIVPAKLLGDYMKKNPKSSFAFKGGFVEGKVVDVNTLNALSELPSKNALVAQVLGTFQAPIAALARAIAAIAEQKNGGATEAAAE